ncbi:Vacuolar protein sorting-associated protein 13C, partial [Acipenser ruthenus]
VVVKLTKPVKEKESPFLVLHLSKLGTETRVRNYDLSATAYLKKINMKYLGFTDPQNRPIHLISSSDKPGSDLLKVEFIKVAFSSLNLLLHTQALLSTISFMTAALPSSIPGSAGKDQQPKSQGGDSEKGTVAKTVSKGSKDKAIFDLKVFAVLDSFHVVVCDERRKIADIKVQVVYIQMVLSWSLAFQAVSIVGDEVFSFNMALYPNATEGDAYTDTSNVDGKVTLRVGCIQIVYLHKFLMSLLKFVDNFQTAKEALSVATAQAAEKAASSVRDFAQKSFRLSMDIKLKAPVIIIPQSSVSQNAVEVDLGLITVQNQFCLVPADGCSLPPVIDKMDVQLTKLKLSRVVLQGGSSQPNIEILQPINLDLAVNRNLAASWYNKIPAVEIKGGLETMNVVLSQEDLGVLMKILVENIAEGSKELSGENLTNVKAEDKSKTPGMIKLLSSAAGETGSPLVNVNTSICEEVTKVLLSFEIKEVVVKLTKPVKEKESPFLVLHVSKLGTETKVRNYDLSATAYLKKINMKYLGFTGEPLNIIRSSDEPGADLLKVEYYKADKNGPDFKTVYNNTEQMISAVSIVGDEVFSFNMALYPNATEGDAYTDTSNVDGKVTLRVGCIQIVYLHKFLMSLVNFSNNFQTAKEALSVATAQAAEKAASSVRDFAQKSFRLSMDIKLKAPVIVIPQSSVSQNAVEVDLGLITVQNQFCLVPADGCSLPPVIDKMDVQLTKLKLSRILLQEGSVQPNIELLQPVNLRVSVKRNLAAAWYQKIPAIEINGDLKPMKKTPLSQRQDSLRLGEFILHLMTASGKMFEDGALEASTKLTACTLDDCRQGIQRVTSRMVDKKDDGGDSVMIDLSFTQSQSESSVVAVLQKLYVCASVEFLLAVADFFIKAMPQGPSATPNKSNQLQLKQVNVPRAASEKAPDSSRSKMKIKAVVIDPEVVFVASLMKADAPALAASFQCDFTLVSEGASQKMTASLRELKVLACPFLRDKGDKAVTTVLRPACLTLETRLHQTEPLTAAVTVDAIVVKISPMILNTVMTIVAAMTPKAQEVGSQVKTEDVSNLWAVKNLNNCSYWFLGVDMASEVTDKFSDREGRGIGENLVVDVKLVQVTMESGLGHRTVPLLLAESSFKGKAQDWTSLLNISADMTLEVHYYNEMQAAWEPLIERVEDGRRRWNLKLEMKNNPIQDKSPVPGDDFVVLPEAQTAINICAKDTMNITISKCCLHVFTNLAKAFSEGTATTFDHSLKEKAPYTIKNALGIPLQVQHSSNLRALGFGAKERIHEVGVGQSVKLEYAVIEHIHRGRLSVLQRQESCLFSLSIVPNGYSEIANIPIAKPSRRLYNVRSPMFEDAVSVLTQIDATEGNKVITVRSPLQIKNHFSIPFAIYKLSMKTRSLEPVGEAEPEKEFHVPLDSYRCQLFLRPVGMLDGQFKESSTFIAWKEELHRSSEVRAVLQCPSSEINYLPLIVNTVAVPDELSFISSHGEEDWDPAYLIHLRPTVTIRNLLPYTICYLLEGAAETHELTEGSSADVHSARISGEIMELVLVKYQGRNWSGHMKIHEGLPEFFLVCFTSNSLDSLSVDLSVHVGRASGQMVLSVFSPYWIINKTSRVLQYRAEEIQIKHPSDFRDVILFSFKKKNIFSKNKVQLCVSTSTWSSSFSLDTVGSYGCVKCPANNMDYLVGVSIQMSSFNLTRIVMMSPFYTLVNKSSFELEVGEVQTTGTVTNGKWHYIAAAECLPLWPETTTGKLCVRVVGSETASKSFFFNKQDNGTLLGMDLCGGIIAAVNIADHATVISFSDYYEGAAPALIINHTLSLTLKYQQSGNEELGKEELKPGEAKLFAWNNPAAIRKLSWSCPQQTGELDLLKDESGQFCYNRNTQIHWVSFLDGRQRVLLFTEDVAIVTKARQAEEMEQFEKEINVSLQNLGLSLINNETKQEISYIGITRTVASGILMKLVVQ